MITKQISDFPIPIEKEEIGNGEKELNMTTEKQLLANLQNAKASTGPITIEGKEIVATNAIKHGIFTKDLIIASGEGQENQAEYDELLANLTQCLFPRNQMESLIVEKIAVDFWRLRRTIRFETGSINKHIEYTIKSYYSSGKTDNDELDRQIEYAKKRITWNAAYVKHLEKNEVSFDKPTWEGKTISSDVIEDFRLIAGSLPNLTRAERDLLYKEGTTFEILAALLARHGYSQGEHIATRLIELYSAENERRAQEIDKLHQKKALNQMADLRNTMIGFIPPDEDAEKALKYERSIQKSIFQNLFLLKKLQGVF